MTSADGSPQPNVGVGKGLLIRSMEVGDIDAVLAIERVSSPDPWTPGILHDELHGTGRCYHVATIDGHVVAFCGILIQVGEAHVTNIAVAPGVRGRRIAAHLLLPSVRWALDQHVGALTLEVRVGNEPAIRLYRRFGFAPVGTRPAYYPNGDDALILWAHDVDSAEYEMRLRMVETFLATPRMEEEAVGHRSTGGGAVGP